MRLYFQLQNAKSYYRLFLPAFEFKNRSPRRAVLYLGYIIFSEATKIGLTGLSCSLI